MGAAQFRSNAAIQYLAPVPRRALRGQRQGAAAPAPPSREMQPMPPPWQLHMLLPAGTQQHTAAHSSSKCESNKVARLMWSGRTRRGVMRRRGTSTVGARVVMARNTACKENHSGANSPLLPSCVWAAAEPGRRVGVVGVGKCLHAVRSHV